MSAHDKLQSLQALEEPIRLFWEQVKNDGLKRANLEKYLQETSGNAHKHTNRIIYLLSQMPPSESSEAKWLLLNFIYSFAMDQAENLSDRQALSALLVTNGVSILAERTDSAPEVTCSLFLVPTRIRLLT